MWARHRRWIEPLAWSLGLLGLAAAVFLPRWLAEGSAMRFESPWLLLGLLAVPLVVAAGMLEGRASGRVRHPLARLLATTRRGWRARLLPASTGLRAAAVALLVVALARPQDADDRQETELEGIDIVLTLDLSGSMKVDDLEPSRLEAA